MSENERLREALRDMIALSVEDDSMWELHETSFRERRRAARNALAAKPDVCVWTPIRGGMVYHCSCDGMQRGKSFHSPMWDIDVEDYEEDGRCGGCGAKIEVRE